MNHGIILDLGEWAEDHFSALCARAGVTRNKSRQDRTGWDYLIEFSPAVVAGLPADLQSVGVSARAQIKSKRTGTPYVDLKLSNALLFAKNPTPCFLILYLASDGAEPVRIFGRHFWRDEIETVLRRARQAHEQGRDDLHKLTVRFSFTHLHQHDENVVQWIEEVVASRSGYAEEKMELARTVGFEEGRIHGTINLALEDMDAFVDHQIGLTPAAPPVNITINERRFGIDSKIPVFDAKPDFARLQSHPLPCRVRIRPRVGPDLWLDGNLFVPAIPGLPLEYVKLRMVADCLELIITGKGTGGVTIDTSLERQRSLGSHRTFLNIMGAAASGPMKVQITTEGSLPIPVELEFGHGDQEALQQHANVIACLEQVASGVLPPDLTLSVDDINHAWNAVVHFNGLVTGTNFKGRFELAEALPAKPRQPTQVFLYDHVEIGSWAFGAVVKRQVEAFTLEGTVGEIALGPPQVVEALVRRGTGADLLPDLLALYKDVCEAEKENLLQMCGGHYSALMNFSRNNPATFS